MKIQLAIILFILSTTSCGAQKREVIAKSTIKLEGRNTDIRDLIDIDGYYYQSLDSSENDLTGGQIFFEDGTAGSFWYKDKENVTESMTRENLSQVIYSWKQKNQIRWSSYCSVYRIEGDTIIEHSFLKAGFLNSHWSLSETKYKVIDRHTLKRIYSKSLLKIDEAYYKNNHPYGIQRNFFYKFVPADSLPSSDCWLKEEKWIWRYESDWKNYMEKIKKKKK